MIELRHLRSLQAIDATGSLALAAEQLHLTQSALSHQIKTLEHYFDVPLYHRQNKPLKLTAAGESLLALAHQVLPEVELVEYRLKRTAQGDAGRLHITIECHSCFEWLIPVLDVYRSRWPEVEVDIRLGVNFDPLPALLQGDIDLVITSDRQAQKNVAFTALFDYEAMAVLANDHPLVKKNRVYAEDFQQQTLITYPVPQNRLDVFRYFLTPAGVTPQHHRQTELTAMILQLVASRRGIAVLPDWVLQDYLSRQYVSARALGKEGMKGTVYAAVRQREAGQPYVEDFIQLAVDGLGLRNQKN